MSAPLRQAALALRDLRSRVDGSFEYALAGLSGEELRRLSACWQLTARPTQLRPEGCKPIWLRSCGRGEGKTRSAAEETLDKCEDWGEAMRGILCSKTIGDVRAVMIEGESGLEACAARRGYQVKYIPSKREVRHPSGAVLHMTTSEKPDHSRGLQSNYFWGDEISSWMHPIQVVSNMLLGWRLPSPEGPMGIFTTSPKPNPIMFDLIKAEKWRPYVTVTGGSTYDNASNLDDISLGIYRAVYEGTRLGQQELLGLLLEGLGAIVDQDTIHRFRVSERPALARRVVALDPSITAEEDSDAAGIVVVGADGGAMPEAYVLDDCTLETATFRQWAEMTVAAFVRWDCDCVVAEVNQGGGGIVEAIQSAAQEASRVLGREVVVPVRTVWAKESKTARAEPVGALYERGRVHHLGHFPKLEFELTDWMPGKDSPNRMDALVYAVSHLLLGGEEQGNLLAYANAMASARTPAHWRPAA